MPSPLEIYKSVVKEFGVEDKYTVSPVGKLTYNQEQIQQKRTIINRLLFDITTAEIQQANAKDETTKNAHRSKADSYKADLRQLLATVKSDLEIVDELRKEYPELAIEE